METKKQEAICLAYGKAWDKLDLSVQENILKDKGGYTYEVNESWLSKKMGIELEFKGIYCRPKSLSGLENNRGWISIESEEGLPKESYGNYHVFTKDPIYNNGQRQNMEEYWQNDSNKRHWWMENVTHYQPIQKPNPPIF